MSCNEWEEEIALLAGGDEVSADFLQHLQRCGCCQRELRGFREARALWADWRAGARPNRIRWWMAAAAGMPLLAWSLWPQQTPVETLTLSSPPAPSVPVVAVPGPVLLTRVLPGSAIRAQPSEKQFVPVSMKLFTDDPDVLILLVGDDE